MPLFPIGQAVFTLNAVEPSMPKEWLEYGWEVEDHKGLGVVEVRFADGDMYINDRKVDEYFSTTQHDGYTFTCDLQGQVGDKPVLQDAILDLLIKEQDNPAVKMFLQKHKAPVRLFFGTIYRHPDNGSVLSNWLYVRFLSFDGWSGRWVWGHTNPHISTWRDGDISAFVLA